MTDPIIKKERNRVHHKNFIKRNPEYYKVYNRNYYDKIVKQKLYLKNLIN